VYETNLTRARGVEFLMGYYTLLDRAPKGRDEGSDTFQLWIRRHTSTTAAANPRVPVRGIACRIPPSLQ
jgi:predicted dithiol-disulfide oxidoreductase (DUF899 family)